MIRHAGSSMLRNNNHNEGLSTVYIKGIWTGKGFDFLIMVIRYSVCYNIINGIASL